ncbi:hypothetical protein SEA_RASPUTIA_108 [Microbacterium phage Rasputia]|nr:hypothetical protein SEA_RASPUTIA_108 [Microbacterium phage Rasputia]
MSSMFPNPILSEMYARWAEREEKHIRSYRRWRRVNLVFGWTGYAFGLYFSVMGVVNLYRAVFDDPMFWWLTGVNLGCAALWFAYTAPRSLKTAREYLKMEEDARQRRGEYRLQADLYGLDESVDEDLL